MNGNIYPYLKNSFCVFISSYYIYILFYSIERINDIVSYYSYFFLNDMPVVIANLYVNETRYIEVQSIDSKSHERESKVILIIHQL